MMFQMYNDDEQGVDDRHHPYESASSSIALRLPSSSNDLLTISYPQRLAYHAPCGVISSARGDFTLIHCSSLTHNMLMPGWLTLTSDIDLSRISSWLCVCCICRIFNDSVQRTRKRRDALPCVFASDSSTTAFSIALFHVFVRRLHDHPGVGNVPLLPPSSGHEGIHTDLDQTFYHSSG